MKFHVNADCIGCGLCVSTCPEVFTMTDGGTAAAAPADVTGPDEAAATGDNVCGHESSPFSLASARPPLWPARAPESHD